MNDEEKQPTEDEKVFGKDTWVYCMDHVKPHLTGWCGVGVNRKLGLGISGGIDNVWHAVEKCHAFGLKIYGE